MSYTNQTPHYGLPQYIGSDIPTVLQDLNGSYSKIDTEIYNAKKTAEDVGDTVEALTNRVAGDEAEISSVANTANANTTAIATTNNNVSAVSSRVTTVEQNVNNINTTVTEVQDELSDLGDDVKDNTLNITSVEGRVTAIENIVPSNASASNKLATIADVSGGGEEYTAGFGMVITSTNKIQLAPTHYNLLSSSSSGSTIGDRLSALANGVSVSGGYKYLPCSYIQWESAMPKLELVEGDQIYRGVKLNLNAPVGTHTITIYEAHLGTSSSQMYKLEIKNTNGTTTWTYTDMTNDTASSTYYMRGITDVD